MKVGVVKVVRLLCWSGRVRSGWIRNGTWMLHSGASFFLSLHVERCIHFIFLLNHFMSVLL